VCLCPEGFEGQFCEIDIDDCDPDPCQNGGICEDYPGYYECTCPELTTGDNCEIVIKV